MRRPIPRAALALALALAGCVGSSVRALDSAVMAYDRTTVDLNSKLLLVNIARAHRDRPMHFTTVSSIAATYDFRFSAGIGPAATGDVGYLPMPSIGGTAGENPTITITPMQGDEFTQRLLTPFDEDKMAMLLRQGYDVDALLRLMAHELRTREGGREVVSFNRPADREGYTRFRRLAAHLSTVQDRHALHAEPLQYQLDRFVPAAAVSSEDVRLRYDDPSLVFDPERQLYRMSQRYVGRFVITNYDPQLLTNDERVALNEEARRGPSSDILVDLRAGFPGGELPFHGIVRMRSFLNVLTFVGRGIAAEPEFDVAPDPRTPPLQENPARTLDVVEAEAPPDGADLFVRMDGRAYALRPEPGYPWNKKAFSLLYQLFQMSVAPAPQSSPVITIAK